MSDSKQDGYWDVRVWVREYEGIDLDDDNVKVVER